jgi:hypothetical protein
MSRIKTYGGHAKRVIKLSCQKAGKVPSSAKEEDPADFSMW